MSVVAEIVRPDDLLNLRVEGLNLRLDASDPAQPVWVVDQPGVPARLVVSFPPQSIAERAFFEADVVPPDGANKPGPRTNATTGADATANDPLLPPGQVPARGARSSRLVFDVPAAARIPYSVAGLLDWTALALRVPALAAIPENPTAEQVAQAPGIAAPESDETALELPYRLLIAPGPGVGWRHRTAPFAHAGRTELWHTRLVLLQPPAPGGAEPGAAAVATELSRAQPAPLRAVWSPDVDKAKDPTAEDAALGLTAISPNDRHQIVVLTSAFRGYEVPRSRSIFAQVFDPVLLERPGLGAARAALPAYVPYLPRPFHAEQLMLSPLGGWLKSRGAWTPPREAASLRLAPFAVADLLQRANGPGAAAAAARAFIAPKPGAQLDLSEWTHVATQGRDHAVRIVYEGVLWPFGHKAALIKITERQFKTGPDGTSAVAYLMQRMFIVVREPERRFADGDRAMPLKTVRLTTLVTPNIARPRYEVADPAAPADATRNLRAFWVEVQTAAAPTARARFSFHAVGVDVQGQQVDFTVPLMFVSVSVTAAAAAQRAVADFHNRGNTQALLRDRSAAVPGQPLYLAPRADNDNTRLTTHSLAFTVDRDSAAPRLLLAEVTLPAVQAIVGGQQPVPVRLYAPYVAGGLDAGTGVFAEVARFDPARDVPGNPQAAVLADTLGVNFAAEQGGGFATPSMAVSTLTRQLGPLAGQAAQAVADVFNPADFFQKGLARLFGTFDLADLLPASSASSHAPTWKVQRGTAADGTPQLKATLDWQPQVGNLDLGVATFVKDRAGVRTALVVHGEVTQTLAKGAPPVTRFTGTLNDFAVTVLQSVQLNVVLFGFAAASGAKPDITVRLDKTEPVVFIGPLKFVEEVRNIIPPGLFGSGASLDITPAGIRAGFAVGLPPVAVGVFALKDVSLGAALTLPILGDGRPTFDFNVSQRAHPFLLTVGLFGGGGFFRLQLDTAGMQALEVSLEFGAAISVDLGLASGGVHVMAGIYFGLQRNTAGDMRASLTGFLRMGGYLRVLGFIKVSLEFNLSFTYKEVGKAFGRAELCIEVQIAFISKTVTLTLERQFGGTGSDPQFGQLFDTDDAWAEYALAFS